MANADRAMPTTNVRLRIIQDTNNMIKRLAKRWISDGTASPTDPSSLEDGDAHSWSRVLRISNDQLSRTTTTTNNKSL
jgi:hypothetical protein